VLVAHPIIPASLETEIRRIAVPGQLQQSICETAISITNKQTNKKMVAMVHTCHHNEGSNPKVGES
jgi:hypothetical protein